MRILKQLLGMAVLSLAALGAVASPANPEAGIEYVALPVAQPTDAGKKIEVIEFFAYWCPHCNAFEPQLTAWAKKQGANIVLKRIHVPYNERTVPQQKLFFTLEAMGLTEQYQAKVFQAMHVQHEKFAKDEEVFAWVAKNGIDRDKFMATYRSLPVQNRLPKADKAMNDYGIDSWPMIIVDGRYKTSPHLANSATLSTTEAEDILHAGAIKVMDFLVAKVKAEKK